MNLTLFLDFAVQPYSVGDTILALVAAEAVADERGLDGVDIMVVIDSRRVHADPNMGKPHADPWPSLGKLLPLFSLIDVGTVTICTDANAARVPAECWNWWPAHGTYLLYDSYRRIADYHGRHGHIPRLHFSEDLLAWADRHLLPRMLTVNLRRNPAFHTSRNYNPQIWAEVMETAIAELGVSFMVVCEAQEIDDTLRENRRVYFAKDMGTSLIEDLALIHRSPAHVGSPSGPGTIACLGEKPYFFPAADMERFLPLYGGTLRKDAGYLVYSFASPGQRWSPQPESVPLLLDEIRELVRRGFPT